MAETARAGSVIGRRLSLRARITLVSTVVVTIALVAGSALFVLQLRNTLVAELATGAENDASEIVAELETTGGVVGREELDSDERIFQVIAADGSVAAASEDVPRDRTLAVGDDSALVRVDDEQYVIVSDDSDNGVKVIAGRSLENVDDTMAAVIPLLAVAVPILILLVTAISFVATGRALRPVERMRREVEEVSSTNLHSRIEHPGSSDEIGRLATTMNAMLERLEGAQATQRRFISDASHELKSPLASLRQYAEVANAHPDRVTAAELSEAILDEGARLERLVAGLLTLAKADEHSLGERRMAVDLDDLLMAEARRVRETSSLTVDSSRVGSGQVRGDPALLASVVRNLVDNAARHARNRIALALREDVGTVILEVDDDGPGVPPADSRRIFDRFVRLDEARAKGSGGSGLGLAIVREIVAASGGTVAVGESVLGGARFEVLLPAASGS